MADQKERPGRQRPTRKRAVKKASNSKVGEAQKAAQDKQGQKPKNLSPAGQGSLGGPVKLQAGKPVAPSPAPTQTTYSGGQNYNGGPPKTTTQNDPGPSMASAAKKIVGLAAPMQAAAQAEKMSDPQAFVNLYGGPVRDRAARISANLTAITEAQNAQAKSKGQAVYMGTRSGRVKTRVVGDMPDTPGSDTYLKTSREEILTKNVLMSWLTDPEKVDQITAAAKAAGLDVTSYEDVQKLWGSVVDQAGDSYSLTGKKVTPWALIQLRGKYAVNGKPADKVTTNTSIDEMSPSQARLMFEQTAQQQLGRAPTTAEIDDFIAKAQTIAHDNPVVSKTTTQIGFDGQAGDSTNVTTGQGEAAAKSQLASMDAAKQTEDYAAYQAAGNYFPTLFEALQSPV